MGRPLTEKDRERETKAKVDIYQEIQRQTIEGGIIDTARDNGKESED